MNLLSIILVCLYAAFVPLPRSASSPQLTAREARKVDEYGYGPGKGRARSADALNAHLANLAHFLREEPSARGYMIYYRGRSKKYGTTHPFSPESQYSELIAGLGITKERIVTVDGGCRNEPMMELWVVPDGAVSPKPTPTCRLRKK